MVSGSVYAALNSESVIGVSVISPVFLTENREAVKRYFQVWNRAVDFIRQHKDEAREILRQRLKLRPEVSSAAAWVNVTKVDETSRDKVKETAVTFQKLGVIDPNVVVDDSFFIPKNVQD
jgi:ABC-type nitrate/sulfonate/bicarbonate transport system substrate-binding protein